MRGILIDPFEQTITEVDPQSMDEWVKKMLKVDLVTAVTVWYDEDTDRRETLWVDDEGLFVKDQKYFQWKGYEQPLAGRGIILGTDAEGETIASDLRYDYVVERVEWLPDVELDHMESIPEGTTQKHPMFGDMEVPVIGSYPVFRHKSKEPRE